MVLLKLVKKTFSTEAELELLDVKLLNSKLELLEDEDVIELLLKLLNSLLLELELAVL
jgi:hypothetical protein